MSEQIQSQSQSVNQEHTLSVPNPESLLDLDGTQLINGQSINKKQPSLNDEIQPNQQSRVQENNAVGDESPSPLDLIGKAITENEGQQCLNVNPSEHAERQNYTDEEPDVDQNCYRELTNKLETALKKISSSKKIIGKSSKNSQNLSLYTRFEECQLNKTKIIEQKRVQKQQREIKQLKDKPSINRHSQKIAKHVGHQPIYKRFEKIVEEKKKKLEENEELKKREREEEYEKFLEEFQKNMKIPDSVRSYEEYFEQMVRWREKKDKECLQKKEDKRKRQLQLTTFKPKLNAKSEKMVKSTSRIPIYERQVKQKKPFVPEYSFTPKINKRKVVG